MCPPHFVRNQSNPAYRVTLTACFSTFTFSKRLLQGTCVLAPGSGEVFSRGFFDEPMWIDHRYSFYSEMRVLAPSLAFSVFALCVVGTKIIIRIRKYKKHKKYLKADVVVTSILVLLDILLLLFSIWRVEIALQVLLSLASADLIFYQVSCPVLRGIVLTGGFEFSVHMCIAISI
jgi:hypothetical protein